MLKTVQLLNRWNIHKIMMRWAVLDIIVNKQWFPLLKSIREQINLRLARIRPWLTPLIMAPIMKLIRQSLFHLRTYCLILNMIASMSSPKGPVMQMTLPLIRWDGQAPIMFTFSHNQMNSHRPIGIRKILKTHPFWKVKS